MINLQKSPYYPGVSNIVIDSLNLYVNNRCCPGGFLTAVLENDLAGAIVRADSHNKMTLNQIVGYICNYLPSSCWGSPEKVHAWLNTEKPVVESETFQEDEKEV